MWRQCALGVRGGKGGTSMAAPKPLSMLTVATPGAPAVSADSSGLTPPSAAPYPTLVGTAICAGAGANHHNLTRHPESAPHPQRLFRTSEDRPYRHSLQTLYLRAGNFLEWFSPS